MYQVTLYLLLHHVTILFCLEFNFVPQLTLLNSLDSLELNVRKELMLSRGDLYPASIPCSFCLLTVTNSEGVNFADPNHAPFIYRRYFPVIEEDDLAAGNNFVYVTPNVNIQIHNLGNIKINLDGLLHQAWERNCLSHHLINKNE